MLPLNDMASLRYSSWLHIDHTKGTKTLRESSDALRTLGIPKEAAPSMALLVGRKAKSLMLRHLLPGIHSDYFGKPHGQAFLWHDTEDEGHLIIDYELHNYDKPAQFLPLEDELVTTRAIDCAKLSEQCLTRRQFGNLFSARALAPMCHTVCYFASDLGGLRGVATLLAAQISQPSASKLPPQCLPHVLVVVDTSSRNFDSAAVLRSLTEAIDQMTTQEGGPVIDTDARSHCTTSPIERHFSELQVLGLSSLMPPFERALQLRERLNESNQRNTMARELHNMSFQRDHFFAMIERLFDHFESSWKQPFSFIKASRPLDFCLDEVLFHLKDLFDLLPAEVWIWHLVCPLLASAILLTNYPPHSHDFAIEHLYRELYQPLCRRAFIEASLPSDLHTGYERALIRELERLWRIASHSSVAVQHSAWLAELRPYTSRIYSYKTCLCCLHRTPEKVLSCKHALCNECIRIYGRAAQTGKYCYVVEKCPLCDEPHTGPFFRQIPPTAGVRQLALDGGGVRGIIQLVFLDRLQQRLNKMHIPIMDAFDFVCGTSAGGLVIIALFLMQWTTGHSIVKFERLAESTFGQKTNLSFARLQQLALSYVRDGRYDPEGIEKTFGSNAKMFNPLASDVKVAVTTTTTKASRPCLITNYNGGVRPSTIGYDLIRASRPEADVKISDAASCTSAAPWFFKPKTIPNLGTFQDGGLQHNNPLNIALWELRFIWPNRETPDFALSIGTGSSQLATAMQKPGPLAHGRDRFIVRLLRSFMRSIDGEKIWDDFHNTLPFSIRKRYHRLNLPIDGPEPNIDDVEGMHRLKEQAINHSWTPQELDPVMDSIIASMFYFEFDHEPIARNGSFHCSGHIFVRVHLMPSGRKELLRELVRTMSFFIVLGQPVRCVDYIPKTAPLFKRKVQFQLTSLIEPVTITLRGITSTPTTISGLPKSAEDLLKMQRLRAPFGTIDHAVPEKPLPRLPLKRKAR